MKKILSVLIVLVMLAGMTAYSESKSAYVSLSDPYFTDGVNEYDFSGVNVNFELSADEDFAQFILSLITSGGQVRGALEFDNQAAYLYADGFSNPYGITYENVSGMIGALNGKMVDASFLKPMNLFGSDSAYAGTADGGMAIADLIYEAYAAILGDAEQIKTAKTGTVATFSMDSMTAFAVPIDLDEEETEKVVLNIASAMDAEGLFDVFAARLGDAAYILETESGEKIGSFAELYEAYLKPFALSVHGNTYYGENDIFVNVALYSEGVRVLSVFLEVTNTEYPVMYMNVPFKTEEGEVILYATVEGASDRTQDYVEFGLLNNQETMALVIYQKAPAENGEGRIYDLYAGAAFGGEVTELSAVYESDDKTARKLKAEMNLSGIQFAIGYDGVITVSSESKAEVGDVTFASNIGISAKARVGFGSGSEEAESIIPSLGSVVDLANMTEEQSKALMENGNALLSKVMVTLSEIPFFAHLFGDAEAEG